MKAMRSKRASLLVFLLFILAVFSCEKKTVTRANIDSSPAVMVVPSTIEAVSAAVVKAFTAGDIPSDPINLSKFKLYRYGEPGFPSDFALQQPPENNPELRNYGTLTAAQRRYDFYAEDVSGDYYWDSEYLWDGQPAKFSSKFIIHIDPQGPQQLRIEVLELGPVVWIGKSLQLGHNGPDSYNDIRNVAPTNRDPKLVLSAIRTALR